MPIALVISIFIQKFTNQINQCSELQSKLGSQVSFPGSATFIREQNDTAVGYWSFQEQEVIPACRLTPNTTKDVSIAVSELAKLHCQFAVRGAGHMFWAGSANIAGGVTIDLSSFTSVSVSADRKITSAGGGTRWSAIYNKLNPIGLSIVGGRVFDVGIGGLTIGGMWTDFHSPHRLLEDRGEFMVCTTIRVCLR